VKEGNDGEIRGGKRGFFDKANRNNTEERKEKKSMEDTRISVIYVQGKGGMHGAWGDGKAGRVLEGVSS